METFSEHKQSNTVHVEVIAAARASAQGDQQRGNDQDKHPHAEHGSHRHVRRGYCVSDQ